jgi:uncharacterized protein (DUF58 family)
LMDKLLDAREIQLIAQLSLAAKRRIGGLVTGEQRSPVQGGGIEFVDYRAYESGDDIRRIDWTVFLRLRRLLVKLCAEEKELTLMLIIDNSRSMRYGHPDKLWVAQRIAAVLAGISLHGGNRAGVVVMEKSLREVLSPGRGRANLADVIQAISTIEPALATDPVSCIRQFAMRYGRKCLAVFLSDLLFADWPKVISGLAASGCEGYVLQLMAPEELEPPFLGEVTLDDLEGLGEVPLHVGEEISKAYQRQMRLFLQEVRQTSRRFGMGHALLTSDLPLARLFHSELRREGLLC